MITIVTNWAYVPNAPMLALRVEKPPVATAVNVWQVASNKSISPIHKSRMPPTVMMT